MEGDRDAGGMFETEPSFRYDPMTGRHVLLAPNRASITPERNLSIFPKPLPRCPFCPGNESDTERVVAAVPSEGPWRIRSVFNKYPAVGQVEAGGIGAITFAGSGSLFQSAAAHGVHEVIIESPAHDRDMPDYTPEHTADVLRMYRDRLLAASARDGIRGVSVFRNRGRRAGSSQPHPHGQVVALAIESPEVALRHELSVVHARKTGIALLDTMLHAELRDGRRIIARNEHFVALCPFASHAGYAMWLVPVQSAGSFASIDDERLRAMADLLIPMLRSLRQVASAPDYNLIWRLPPLAETSALGAAWYLEVRPRRGGGAGFEITSGIDIVTVLPEMAAAQLREEINAHSA